MKPLVSVVIANHNHGRYLGDCLVRVLRQSYAPIEVVVVDDGSTDDSREVLRRFDGRVRIVLQQNAGQAAALSAGVRAARGELVALLDADDGWAPEKCESSLAALLAEPRAGWLRHKLALVDEGLAPLGPAAPRFSGTTLVPPDARWLLERVVTAPTSALVLRRPAAEAVFPLPPGVDFAFDADVLILARLFAAGIPGLSLDRSLGFYRRHAGQRFATSADVPAMLRRDLAVAAGVAHALGRDADRSVASFKHRAVVAALEGARWWHASRLAPVAAGIGTAIGYADRPHLSMRQLGALLFAYATPQLWLRRLERNMPLGARRSGPGPS